MIRFIKLIVKFFVRNNALFFTELFFKDFWSLRESYIKNPSRLKKKLYLFVCEHYDCWIGLGAEFANKPTFPHGLHGIFISNRARIGADCVIFHQVTIGSNSLPDSKNNGSPTIGNNVYIGCGAKIIGNVTVGDNCRIGANCIITKNIEPNTTCIIDNIKQIHKQEKMNNEFIAVHAINNDSRK